MEMASEALGSSSCRNLTAPSSPGSTGQGHKEHAAHILVAQLLPFLRDAPKGLESTCRSHGDHHPSAILELLNERLGDMVRRRGYDDGIIGCVFFPPIVAIALLQVYLVVSEAAQALCCRLCQLGDDLHRIDLVGDLG